MKIWMCMKIRAVVFNMSHSLWCISKLCCCRDKVRRFVENLFFSFLWYLLALIMYYLTPFDAISSFFCTEGNAFVSSLFHWDLYRQKVSQYFYCFVHVAVLKQSTERAKIQSLFCLISLPRNGRPTFRQWTSVFLAYIFPFVRSPSSVGRLPWNSAPWSNVFNNIVTVQDFGASPLKKILEAKNLQNLVRFRTTSNFDGENLWNEWRYLKLDKYLIDPNSSCITGWTVVQATC